jgi:hypothetical protein
MKPLTYLAMAGNVIYILWIVYNAIDEGFQSIHSIQTVALIGLVVILTLNYILLSRKGA